MPKAPKRRVLTPMVLPLEQAIMEEGFKQPELKVLFQKLLFCAKTFSQAYTFTQSNGAASSRFAIKDLAAEIEFRGPKAEGEAIGGLLNDLRESEAAFASALHYQLRNKTLIVFAHNDIGGERTGELTRKDWATVFPYVEVECNRGEVRLKINARGVGYRLSALRLIRARRFLPLELPPNGQAALDSLIAIFNVSRPHSYESAREHCRGEPFRCSNPVAIRVWDALPDRYKLLNRAALRQLR
jgi:hypothetical protein